MITKETAQKICAILDEIEACGETLTLFEEGKEMLPPSLFITENSESDGVSIDIPRDLAKDVVEKQLEALRDEYKELNEAAARELEE